MQKMLCFLMVVFTLSACGCDVHAVTVGNVAIHGFGGWAYGRTDNENRYLYGDEDGNYDEMNFSLNISAEGYYPATVDDILLQKDISLGNIYLQKRK